LDVPNSNGKRDVRPLRRDVTLSIVENAFCIKNIVHLHYEYLYFVARLRDVTSEMNVWRIAGKARNLIASPTTLSLFATIMRKQFHNLDLLILLRLITREIRALTQRFKPSEQMAAKVLRAKGRNFVAQR